MAHNLLPKALALLGILGSLGPLAPALQGQEGGTDSTAPRYSLAADAAAGLVLAADGLDLASPDSAAAWSLKLTSLQRLEAQSWGGVLSSVVDASGQASGSTTFTPSLTVYEAYARFDMYNWGQFFLGKRRLGLGIGTTFAPGDLMDPRDGFWDQKEGFRGLGLSLSLGPDVSLKAALSLDRSLDAYAAGVKAKAAAGTTAGTALTLAYQEALDGAEGPADPRLFLYSLCAEALVDRLQVAAALVYGEDYALRPSLGASLDVGGLILQAEGAVELSGEAQWYGTGGLHYSLSQGASSLSLGLDYDYNGAPGLLEHTHYLLPSLSFSLEDAFSLYLRSLVELEAPAALVAWGLTLYPGQGYDLELSGLLALGDHDSEFSSLSSVSPIVSPSTGKLTCALGLAARIHF